MPGKPRKPRHPMGRKPRPSSRTRVLDAASRLFSKKGFAATSVDEIADKAGASPSSIYWHFKGGKDDILLAVIEEATKEHTEAILHAVREGKTFEEKTEIFINAGQRQMQKNPETMRLILQMALERAPEDKEVRERIRGIFRRFRDTIVREVTAEFPQLDKTFLKETAAIQIAIFEGIFLQWQLDPEEVDLERIFTVLHLATRTMMALQPDMPPLPGARRREVH